MERKVTLEHYALFAKFKEGRYPTPYKTEPDTEDGYFQLWSRYNVKTTFYTKDEAFGILEDWKSDGITEYKVVRQVWDITETDILFGKIDDKQEAKHGTCTACANDY